MRYFYSKYNVKIVPTYIAVGEGSPVGRIEANLPYLRGYTKYQIDQSTGRFIVDEKDWVDIRGAGSTVYRPFDYNTRLNVQTITSCGNGTYTNTQGGYYTLKLVDKEFKDSLISNEIAEEGFYPDDGKHIDGYWYVKDKAITTKYLIQDKSSVLYTFNENKLFRIQSQTLDDNNFKDNGFNDLTVISEKHWNKTFPNKEDVKILMWTDDLNKQETKMTYQCESFELVNWLKNENCKLLPYTDDLDRKECEMIYNCNPYRPLDKLKENNNGMFDVLMNEI